MWHSLDRARLHPSEHMVQTQILILIDYLFVNVKSIILIW